MESKHKTVLRTQELTVWVSNPGEGKNYFSCPQGSERFWRPLDLLFKGYRSSWPGVKRPSCEGNKPPVLPMSRMGGAMHLLRPT